MDVASLLKMRESRVRVTWENPVRGAHGPSTGSLGIQVGSCNDERTPSPKPPGPPNVAASLAGSKQLPKVGAGPKSGLLQARARLRAKEPRGRNGSLCSRTRCLGPIPSPQHLGPASAEALVHFSLLASCLGRGRSNMKWPRTQFPEPEAVWQELQPFCSRL